MHDKEKEKKRKRKGACYGAGIQTRKARSAAAANIKGFKGTLVTIEVTIRRQWSRLRRSIGSVSALKS